MIDLFKPGWYEEIIEWKIKHGRCWDKHSALWGLVRVVQQLVPGLVQHTRESEHHQAEGEQAPVQPVEQDQSQQCSAGKCPEPPETHHIQYYYLTFELNCGGC